MRVTADCRYRNRRATCGDTAVHKKPKVQGDHYAEAFHAIEPDISKYKGVFRRGNKLWMTLRVSPGKGGWKNLPTPYFVGEEQSAATLRRLTQELIDAGEDFKTAAGGIPTVQAFAR